MCVAIQKDNVLSVLKELIEHMSYCAPYVYVIVILKGINGGSNLTKLNVLDWGLGGIHLTKYVNSLLMY